MSGSDGTMATRDTGPATEVAVSTDMVKRGLVVAPVMIAACLVIWGLDGALSSGYGIVIVLANFALAARLISYTAPISLGLMMGAILFGYLLRLGLIFGAVWIVRDAAWISFPALGATIIVTHLGLLVWELKYVAISLAYPGLKPPEHTGSTTSRTAPPTSTRSTSPTTSAPTPTTD
ncbi:MAG TPA: ATP synthase subunit I [Ilumatobacteraceae bacterium]|nr:ATP synthase subunit I [Ilumatobacteraceae bacterium]